MKPLTLSLMTTVLSFMANMISPIVVISQLGAFMGISMISYFVILHLILIPAWISAMTHCNANSICSPCTHMLRKLGMLCQSLVSKAHDSVFRTVGIRGGGSVTKPSHAGINRKQSRIQGCVICVGLLISMTVVMYGISSIMLTDFGLPLMFKEGVNISDLMYIAKHFKSDLLTMSSKDNTGGRQDTPPTVVTPIVNPTASPTISPNSIACPTTSPTIDPSNSTLFTFAPSAASESRDSRDNNKKTFYTVHICYGIDIEKSNVDGDATAKVNPVTFGQYAEHGLLTDMDTLCNYLAINRDAMDVAMPDDNCIYNELMATTSEDISIFERISLWLGNDAKRSFQVGVEQASNGPGTGNFGQNSELQLSWLCQPISCVSNVSSFLDDPGHALVMTDRWDHAVYDISSVAANQMKVGTLTGSEAWLFPLLSDQLVTSLSISLAISLFGSLSLLFIATWNLKLSLLIGAGMVFVLILTLFLHLYIFSTVIDLIDIVVLLSFIGLIVDFPLHMALHYEHDLTLQREVLQEGQSDVTANDKHFYQKSFGYMRVTLLGPALTTTFAALPLLQADFTLISKAGEYVVIMCVCTYLYIALVMPTLLRLVGEFVFIPCRPRRSLSSEDNTTGGCHFDIIVTEEFYL